MTNTKINDDAFVNIRPCVLQVVEVMELIHCQSIKCPTWRKIGPWPEDDEKRIGEDLADLEYSPHKAVLIDQSRIIWNQVVHRKIPAVWFIRTHRPVTVIMSVICHVADVSIAHLLNGELTDREFDNLTLEVGRLAGSPLIICDASEPDSVQKAMSGLILSKLASLAICDWVLEGEESAMAQRLARELKFTFMCPS